MARKIAYLTRGPSTSEGTFGEMNFGGNFVYTTELPWRNNARAISCIPRGRYLCLWHKSPKFGQVYQVMNVPSRDFVLIHPANFGGDASEGWHTELQGCIAPSLKQGLLRNPRGNMQRAGLISMPAVTKLHLWGATQPFELDIS